RRRREAVVLGVRAAARPGAPPRVEDRPLGPGAARERQPRLPAAEAGQRALAVVRLDRADVLARLLPAARGRASRRALPRLGAVHDGLQPAARPALRRSGTVRSSGRSVGRTWLHVHWLAS